MLASIYHPNTIVEWIALVLTTYLIVFLVAWLCGGGGPGNDGMNGDELFV